MTRRLLHRRHIVAGLAGAILLPATAGAAKLIRTPRQTAGPYYPDAPDRLIDRDADLVTIQNGSDRAPGAVIHVSGRVLRTNGQPVAGARVEIWQADSDGNYAYPRKRSNAAFQGYGTAITGADGAYKFRTIKPGAYGSVFFRRTPHIHFKVSGPGIESLTTQMYFAGEPSNSDDGILNGIRDSDRRARLIVPFTAESGAESGNHGGIFDIVVG